MLMRKHLRFVFALLVVAVCATFAHADSLTDGTLNFTVTSGSPTPTGSFVWDSTTSTWNSFTVNWDGAVYNFAPQFTNLTDFATSGSWCGAAPNNLTATCPPVIFQLPGSGGIIPEGATFTDINAAANGTYTVTETPVATPEPSSLAMLLFGLVALSVVALRRLG